MSTFMDMTVKCALCGQESEQTVIGSTNAFGAPDLDLRPPQMQRSTMSYWVQVCPHCGYVADCLEDPTTLDLAAFQAQILSQSKSRNFVSELAEHFYQQYLLHRMENKGRDSVNTVICAAWACDDAGDVENAAACRDLAVAALEALPEYPQDDMLMLIRADLLRRSGQFEKLLAQYDPANFRDEVHRKVVAFQIEKAKAQDAGCYTTEDALGDMV